MQMPSGDVAVGPDLPGHVRSMERLRDLPARIVHAGHDPSFGRDRLVELADAYLNSRRES